MFLCNQKIYRDYSIIFHYRIDAKSSEQLTYQAQSSVSITRNCRRFRKAKIAAFHVRRSRAVLIAIAHLAIVKEIPPSSKAGNAMTSNDDVETWRASISPADDGNRAVILKAWYPRYNYG